MQTSLTRVVRYARKLRAVYRVNLRECFAYPATAYIWMLSDTVVAVLLPAVWLSASNPSDLIAGFSRREMVTYYLVSIILSQFITCHLMWNIAADIKEGFFSAHIVRPFSYLAQCTARNLAWRVAKIVIFIPIALAFYVAFLGTSPPSPLSFGLPFFAAALLGHALSFLSAYCLSLAALWTVESFSIMEMYYVPEQILSGRLLPLATLPGWVLSLSHVLYFRYTVSFPVEIAMGRIDARDIQIGFVIQAAYLVFFYGSARLLLRAGMKRYTGAGM